MKYASILSFQDKKKWTEFELKAIAQNNHATAMAHLISQFRGPLFHHALCILKDEDEAYDIVQETFVRAIKETRLFLPDFLIKAWLYRVTSNLCFNQMRNTKRRKEILEENPLSDTHEATQIKHIFNGQRQTEVLEAISKLGADHQHILMLRYYEDMSYLEIAQTLQIKLGTVMSRLSRARTTLLGYLERKKSVLT